MENVTGQLQQSSHQGDRYFGIEFASIEPVLHIYCKALTGKEVDISTGSIPLNAFRNLWWKQLASGNPSTSRIKASVPATFMEYPAYDDNFGWYKSVLTQQVSHYEFGSPDFDFDKESSLFENLRYQIHGEEVPGSLALERYLSLFEDRPLAARVFVAVENSRINYLVKSFYPGVATDYRRMQEGLLHALYQLPGMTLSRAFCELLEGLEIDCAHAGLDELDKPLQAAKPILDCLFSPCATVEDSAEAAIRLYDIASKLPQDKFVSLAGGYVTEIRESAFSDLEGAEFTGNFDTGNLKLNLEMRPGAGQRSSVPMTAEELQKLADQQIGINDIIDVDSLPGSGLSVSDIPRGLPIYQFSQDKYHQSGRPQGRDACPPPVQEENEKLFSYDEWDFRDNCYLPDWCCVHEKILGEGSSNFYNKTLENSKTLSAEIKRQFEKLPSEMLYKVRNLDDGDEYDLDLVVNELIDKRAGHTPSGKVYTKKQKVQRDVAVVFLLDMSGSTADLISKNRTPMQYEESIKYNFMKFVMQQRRRIIDIEKESIVLLINAIEMLGDTYGIYGFSGHGRSKVQFLVIKDLGESFSEKVKRRVDSIAPIHGTRMGAAIRHAVAKLDACGCSLKLLFLVSDGYPQDALYGWDDDDKEYAIHDTKMALIEATQKNISPFCLTVDSAGNDYLRTMCRDMGYEVLDDIETLPERLPILYKKLSV
ncbi:MAG: hypothetical protein ABSG90_02945 [Dehalococcoidia bacterium]|jgi:hypothetical protein